MPSSVMKIDVPHVQNDMLQRPYLSSDISGSSKWTSGTGNNTFHDFEQHDLVDFFGLAQSYKVDIIPLKWQPALESLGDGRTSDVSQSLLNIRTSLAFKRAFREDEESLYVSEQESQILPRLCTELSILAYPPLRSHPNILRLEGFCWEYLPDSFGALPVFCFEKAQHGNLENLIKSDRGRQMSLAERMELGIQIAEGLLAMHNCRVIHGDIKPTNTLIFESQGKLVAKVADFGFSTRVTGEGLVQLPRSVPWHAPEHHPRHFSFAAAQKCDFFSFGLLCLWLFFYEDLLSNRQSTRSFLAEKDDWHSNLVRLPHDLRVLGSLKLEEGLLAFSHSMVDAVIERGNQQAFSLAQFFNLTLATDPKQRAGDLAELLGLFSQTDPGFGSLRVSEVTEALEDHCEFRISQYVGPLILTDYRVWGHILEKLKQHAESSSNRSSALNASFQVALCYRIGFGARRNLQESSLWLERSQKSIADLENEKRMLDNALTPGDRYMSDKVQSWSHEGFISGFELVHEFRKAGLLSTLKANIVDIATDLLEELGPNHMLVWYQCMIQCDIFEAEGNFAAAEQGLSVILARIDKDRKSASKKPPSFIVSVIYRLLSVLIAQNKLGLAEEYTKQLVRSMERNYGPDQVGTLKAFVLYGQVLSEKGESKRAEEILHQALHSLEMLLGDQHPSTLATRAKLQDVYLNLYDYEKLELVARDIFKATGNTQEHEHIEHINSAANLSLALESQGEYREAKERGEQALATSEKVLGLENATTLAIVGNLGILALRQRDLSASEVLLLRAIEGHDKLFGKGNRDSLINLGHLAMVYQTRRDFPAAEEMHRRVVDGRMRVLAPNHVAIFVSLANLADCLDESGKYEDAISTGKQALEGYEMILGKASEPTIGMYRKLATLCEAQGLYEDSVTWYHCAHQGLKAIRGADHPDLMQNGLEMKIAAKKLDSLAKAQVLDIWPSADIQEQGSQELEARMRVLRTVALKKQREGDISEAGDIHQALIFAMEKTLGPNHPDTLVSMSDLGSLLANKHDFALAEDLHGRVLRRRERALGPVHEDTLSSASSMADVFKMQDRYDVAEGLYRRASVGREQVLGEEHFLTLISLNNLAIVLMRQGKLVEAQQLTLRVLRTRQRLLGDSHRDSMGSVNNLALIFRKQGNHAKAEELNRQNLDTCKKNLGNDHSSTLTAASNLVTTLICMQEYHTAERLNHDVRRKRGLLLGTDDPSTLNNVALAGRLLYLQGDFSRAQDEYTHLVEATVRVLGQNHPLAVSRLQEFEMVKERVADPWGVSPS